MQVIGAHDDFYGELERGLGPRDEIAGVAAVGPGGATRRITHLRKLEDSGYVTTQRNGSGVTARTSVALTGSGRAALERYTTTLRQLLDSASRPQAREVLPDALA